MMKRPQTPRPKACNGIHRVPPVEPLSARIFRLRIARGYSIYELATAAGVLPCTIQRLESGRPVDKRVLPALATALGVPLCRLVCGEHSCLERACVPPSGDREPSFPRCTPGTESPPRQSKQACGPAPFRPRWAVQLGRSMGRPVCCKQWRLLRRTERLARRMVACLTAPCWCFEPAPKNSKPAASFMSQSSARSLVAKTDPLAISTSSPTYGSVWTRWTSSRWREASPRMSVVRSRSSRDTGWTQFVTPRSFGT